MFKDYSDTQRTLFGAKLDNEEVPFWRIRLRQDPVASLTEGVHIVKNDTDNSIKHVEYSRSSGHEPEISPQAHRRVYSLDSDHPMRAALDTSMLGTNGGRQFHQTRLFTAYFFVYLYYMAYRYVFQWNSSATSATYTDTPLLVQLGKYLILISIATVALVIAASGLGRRSYISFPVASYAMFAISFFCLAKGLLGGMSDLLELGIVFFVGWAATTLVGITGPNLELIVKLIAGYIMISLVYEAIQIALYVFQGRLPALAWPNSLAIRFGATLDDPNGWGLLVAMLVPVALGYWRGNRATQWFAFAGLIVTLLLTQSFTAIVAVAFALALAWIIRSRLSVPGVYASVLGSVVVIVAVTLFLSSNRVFRELLDGKQGSIAGHAESLEGLRILTVKDIFGLSFSNGFWESSYVSLFHSIGVPFTMLYIGLGILSVLNFAKLARRSVGEIAGFYWGYFAFQVSFLIGSFNMRYHEVFPINGLFAMGIALSLIIVAQKDSECPDVVGS